MKIKKSLLILSIVIASLMMQGCGTLNKPVSPQIPANLLVKCDKYKSLENNSMGELLTRYIESLEIGAECAAKVDAWIKIGKALK